MGTTGLILVTIAAAFSTASAINATLFSTARLMESVSQKKDLPQLFAKENSEHIPHYALFSIAGLAAALAILGSLGSLVDAASTIFLLTFGVVNWIAFRQEVKLKWLCLTGAISCGLAISAAVWEQWKQAPYALIAIFGVVLCLFIFRPYLLKKFR